jgi:hypothetical protein
VPRGEKVELLVLVASHPTPLDFLGPLSRGGTGHSLTRRDQRQTGTSLGVGSRTHKRFALLARQQTPPKPLLDARPPSPRASQTPTPPLAEGRSGWCYLPKRLRRGGVRPRSIIGPELPARQSATCSPSAALLEGMLDSQVCGKSCSAARTGAGERGRAGGPREMCPQATPDGARGAHPAGPETALPPIDASNHNLNRPADLRTGLWPRRAAFRAGRRAASTNIPARPCRPSRPQTDFTVDIAVKYIYRGYTAVLRHLPKLALLLVSASLGVRLGEGGRPASGWMGVPPELPGACAVRRPAAVARGAPAPWRLAVGRPAFALNAVSYNAGAARTNPSRAPATPPGARVT